jgi:glycosyltransferase involved in cell wall biosynthesis
MVREPFSENSWVLQPNPAYRAAVAPAVSVVITLFNYAAYIEECLASVQASHTDGMPGGIEVIVVDDASTDASASLVEKQLANNSMPLCLVRKKSNSGLADSRNLGLQLARAPLVFILDADNRIRPDCLVEHYRVLAGSDYAVAFGWIQRFEHATGADMKLMSHQEWDVRELVTRPCIDAMAMLRRDTVLRVGGYSCEYGGELPPGWEDYDLCLKLAQAGQAGKMIPKILSDYRVHGQSMLQKTKPHERRLAVYFCKKFRTLTLAHPDLPRWFGHPRHELLIPDASGSGIGFQSPKKLPTWAHRLFGRKFCHSLSKRVGKFYWWLHP